MATGARWPGSRRGGASSPFKNPHLVASGVSRIIISSEIIPRSDPAHAGCYFFNGLLGGVECALMSVLSPRYQPKR